ncbi:MAG: 3-chlorobenzoate-3,4-dioxygenase [Rhodopirellula sp.]|nr:3-chlorobenzoate-3,4-dioxygenase [Rhodopirellula sp.]OUX51426.1 MAG: 3-chlorobenzoate-3,4-dioxygenase [Rhodopirellula sp. TMED283]
MDRRQFSVTTLSLLGAAANCAGEPLENGDDSCSVAVIGHTGRGDYGHGLDTVWRHLSKTNVACVADADANGLARELVKLRLDSVQGYSDYRLMLREVQPDIVAICPRHVDQHRDMILAAVNAGAKGIYVEKPFVQTLKQLDEVVKACRERGTKLAVAHRNRYHPVLQTIDGLLRDGQIGRLLEIRGRGKGDGRGGAEDLWVLGSHVLNLMSYFGGAPETCSATLYRKGRRVVKEDRVVGGEGLGWLAGDELHATYRFARGVTGYFDSVANDGTQNQGFGLSLIGSQGRIQIWCDDSPLARIFPGNPFGSAASSKEGLPISTAGVGKIEPMHGLHKRLYQHIIPVEDLLDSIRGDRDPICGLEDAGATVEMICGVFESHRLGRTVKFPLVQREHPLAKFG